MARAVRLWQSEWYNAIKYAIIRIIIVILRIDANLNIIYICHAGQANENFSKKGRVGAVYVKNL